ncbi:aminoglycoside phosphotransferase family protein [Elioraea sp.]|uniref:aminoglycoside phosphotransferase family protein n=1 Tax=Elioraea sp. TaxID=2185103 RepID=UPI003F6E6514
MSTPIDAALARRLVAAQFPHWANLIVTPVEPGGWCNRTFRLGAEMAVRLPSADRYVPQVEKEQRWLPALAPALPVSIPRPVAKGQPTAYYPWPWSVFAWIEGETASDAAIPDLPSFAADLAAVLRALWHADTTGGPLPGAHNFHRGGALAAYDSETRLALERLGNTIDRATAMRAWDGALAAEWTGQPVWVHGDLSAGNVLIRNGRLSALLDFGNLAVGDPACDLAIAWTFLDRQAASAFLNSLAPDEGTLARARGWVLWKALIVLAGLPGTDARQVEAASRALARVLADA